MKLLENAYYAYQPDVKPGDLIKLYVDDGQITGKVWVRVIAKMVNAAGSFAPSVYAGRLEQFTVLDISKKQGFVFMSKHVHYVLGQSEKW